MHGTPVTLHLERLWARNLTITTGLVDTYSTPTLLRPLPTERTIRDAARLRSAYPGASDAEIADQLVARAARMTGGIGAATGGLSAAHWFAPPSLLALPLAAGVLAPIGILLSGRGSNFLALHAAIERGEIYQANFAVYRSLPRPEYDGMMSHDPQPAIVAGLRLRPVADTSRDTLGETAIGPKVYTFVTRPRMIGVRVGTKF